MLTGHSFENLSGIWCDRTNLGPSLTGLQSTTTVSVSFRSHTHLIQVVGSWCRRKNWINPAFYVTVKTASLTQKSVHFSEIAAISGFARGVEVHSHAAVREISAQVNAESRELKCADSDDLWGKWENWKVKNGDGCHISCAAQQKQKFPAPLILWGHMDEFHVTVDNLPPQHFRHPIRKAASDGQYMTKNRDQQQIEVGPLGPLVNQD